MADSTQQLPVAPSATRDAFGRRLRDLRVSVTDRCNFRCNYCMPAERDYEFLARKELLTFEEIQRVVRVFASLGVVKIRITGGEPLLRTDLETLVAEIDAVEGIQDIAMTTNGYLLARHAERLAEAGLDRVTVSLDALDPETWKVMTGRDFGLVEALEGIEAAQDAGLEPVKVNTVVQRGKNDHVVVDMARHFKGTGVILRFIEFMDVGTVNGWRLEDVVPSKELVERIGAELPMVPVDKRYPGEVADRYRYMDGEGQIGFVSSVTQPFCGSCTRARLSPQGEVYTCLFGSGGLDLKGPIRSGATDDQIRERIRRLWSVRRDRYSELRTAETDALELPDGAVTEEGRTTGAETGEEGLEERSPVEMFRIGG